MLKQKAGGALPVTDFESLENGKMITAGHGHALLAEGPVVVAEPAQTILLLHDGQQVSVAGGRSESLVEGCVDLVEGDAGGRAPGLRNDLHVPPAHVLDPVSGEPKAGLEQGRRLDNHAQAVAFVTG